MRFALAESAGMFAGTLTGLFAEVLAGLLGSTDVGAGKLVAGDSAWSRIGSRPPAPNPFDITAPMSLKVGAPRELNGEFVEARRPGARSRIVVCRFSCNSLSTQSGCRLPDHPSGKPDAGGAGVSSITRFGTSITGDDGESTCGQPVTPA